MFMFQEFRWSRAVAIWLMVVVIVCSVISFNMPVHPRENETVILPGYQFIKLAIAMIGIAIVLSVFRKRAIILNFEANWLEAFIALNGAAILISPFVALVAKYISH
jgi:hypothetical protein